MIVRRLLLLTLLIYICPNTLLPSLADFANVQRLERPIVLERPSQGRVEEELRNYELEKRRDNITSLIKKGAWAGAGAVGVATLGVSGFVVKGMSRVGVNNRENVNGSWEMLKRGTFWAICGGVSIAFLRSAVGLGSFIISKLFNGNPNIFLPLLPFSKRMEHSLQRLQGAMGELPKHEEGTFFFNHYVCEMADSFTLFVRSLEKFCAILFYELKSLHGAEDIVVVDCTKHINRLFTFCEQVAQEIESDLNKDRWDGFSQATFDLVDALEVGCFSLMPWMRKERAGT